MLLDHVGVNEAGRVGPFRSGSVDRVPELDSVRMLLGHLLDLLAQQNVVFALVGEQQVRLRSVLRIAGDRLHQLVHRRNAGSTGDQADSLELVHDRLALLVLSNGELAVALVLNPAGRSFHLHLVADVQRLQMLRHLTAVRELRVHVFEVDLDHELEVALRLVAGGRRVGADHHVAIEILDQMHVLTDRQTETLLRIL